MDFRDTPEQHRFRQEVGVWLDTALTDVGETEPPKQQEREELMRWWQQRLHADGWAGLSWPEEFGGRGLGTAEEAIFYEEAAKRRAPMPVNMLGMLLAGPTIMVHGTQEQKDRYLPRILSGEEIWCQGFSEPGSGSDLASLSTKARPVDGGWAVTGQKVWTSAGHLAQKCMLLVRTTAGDSKHHGITYLLADMADVDVRPLVMVNGEAEFNEMFLEDVFVPENDLLGEVDQGWACALTTLAFERGGISLSLQVWSRQALDELVELVRDLGLGEDQDIQYELGRLEADVQALRIGSVRTMSAVAAGGHPGPESSTVKLLWARVVQDIRRLGIELAGPGGVVEDEPRAAHWISRYLRARGHSIEGGTDEVQRSIIAERVLGLPRSR
jgi:alkylation response protein AidB-like acyl-CoA dehydrogenase